MQSPYGALGRMQATYHSECGQVVAEVGHFLVHICILHVLFTVLLRSVYARGLQKTKQWNLS